MSVTALRILAPYVALFCAVGMAGIGVYLAGESRTGWAILGIGTAPCVAALAIPMLYLSDLRATLNESIVLLLGELAAIVAYLAVTELVALVRRIPASAFRWAYFPRNYLRSYGLWPQPAVHHRHA